MVATFKDGQNGDAQPFELQIETLDTADYGDAVTSCVAVRDPKQTQPCPLVFLSAHN